MKYVFLICSFVFLFYQGNSQIKVKHYTSEHGLSNDHITGIVQDDYGYIWISTLLGLNRFDGKDFTVFKNNTFPIALPDNLIGSIKKLPNNRLGVCTASGALIVNLYNLSAKYIRIPCDNEISYWTNNIHDICIDKDENIHLSSSTGWYIFNSQYKLINQYNHFTPKDINRVWMQFGRDFTILDDTTITLNARDRNMFYHSQTGIIDTNYFSFRKWYRESILEAQHFIPCFFLNANTCLYPSSKTNSFNLFNPKTGERISFKSEIKIEEVFDWSSKLYHISGNRYCISRFDKGYITLDINLSEKKISYVKDSIFVNGNSKCFLKDNIGQHWYGTSNGVYMTTKKESLVEEIYVNDSMYPLRCVPVEDKLYVIMSYKKNYLLALIKNGTLTFPLKTRKLEANTKDVLRFNEDTLWIAGNDGLYGMNIRTNEYNKINYKNKSIDSISIGIERLYRMRGGDIWLTTTNPGIMLRFDSKEKTFHLVSNKQDSLIHVLAIANFCEDEKGDVWISGDCIIRWSKIKKCIDTSISFLPNQTSFKKGYSLFCLNGNEKWIGTNGSGIAHTKNGKQYEYFSAPKYLSDFRGFSFLHEDNFFYSTLSFLDILNIKTHRIIHITPDEGLCKGQAQKIVFDSKTNSYIILSNHSIYRFNKSSLEISKNVGPIRISNLEINDKKNISYPNSGMEINALDNSLRFSFSVIDFSDVKIHYAYCLIGHDTANWVDIGTESSILFNHLKSGKYIVLVKAYHPSNLSIPSFVKFSFTILTPFYKSYWFIMLCILTLNFLAYVFYRYRINQISKINAIRTNIARDLHDDIGSVLSSISMYSDIAERRNLKNESNMDVLRKISKASKELVGQMSDIVWSLNPKNEQLNQLKIRLEYIAQMTLLPVEIQYKFEMDDKLSTQVLNTSQLKNVYLICKEAIHNSIKYAQCKKILISIQKHGNQLIISIIDDGIGFDKNKPISSLGGNGLINMKNRAEQIRGFIKLSSQIGKGTIVELKFPLKQ